MIFALKLLILLNLKHCVCTEEKEDIASLVSPTSQRSSTERILISLNIKSQHSDSDFDYKKENKNSNDYHTFTPKGNNLITSVYYDKSLVWQGDDNSYSKYVSAHFPRIGDSTIIIKIFRSGEENEHKFCQTEGFYYDCSTIALNINKEENVQGLKCVKNIANKNGTVEFTVDDGKKITLIFYKNLGRNAKLFWKAQGTWHCTKVILTKENGDTTKMEFAITNGPTKTNLVYQKQDDTWVPENTIWLNAKKKDKAPNCRYTANITAKNGTYTYEPQDGLTFSRVSVGDTDKVANLVWFSDDGIPCTKVIATVTNDKITKVTLTIKEDSGEKTLDFEKGSDGWSPSAPQSQQPAKSGTRSQHP